MVTDIDHGLIKTTTVSITIKVFLHQQLYPDRKFKKQMTIITEALTMFTGFFAVMNPVANTPVFVALTAQEPVSIQKKTALRALIIAFVIVSTFCFAGGSILSLFGITLPAVKLAGGIILFFIGYDMLKGKSSHSSDEKTKQLPIEARLSVAVSPIAIPLLAGPGTIAMALNYASSGGFIQSLMASIIFLVLCIISYLFFISGERLVKYLGDSAIRGVTRFMGMIIAILGTQMLIDGILGVIKTHT